MKKLKITLIPAGANQAGWGESYDQQEFDVDDTFEFDVLDDMRWFQFDDTAGTSYAIPAARIVALALQER